MLKSFCWEILTIPCVLILISINWFSLSTWNFFLVFQWVLNLTENLSTWLLCYKTFNTWKSYSDILFWKVTSCGKHSEEVGQFLLLPNGSEYSSNWPVYIWYNGRLYDVSWYGRAWGIIFVLLELKFHLSTLLFLTRT